MNREEIERFVREDGGPYEPALLTAAGLWSKFSYNLMDGVLAAIGRLTQSDDEGLTNVVGLFAFIGLIQTAKLALGERDSVEVRSERARLALGAMKKLTEDIDKPWQILAAEWMENVAQVQDAEGLTGEPEPDWFRKVAAVLRKEPEYLAKKKAADMADDATGGA